MRYESVPAKPKPRRRQDLRTHRVEFDGLSEMVAESMRPAVQNRTRPIDLGAGWLGRDFDSVDEAVHAATQNWPEGVAVVERMVAKLAGSIPSPVNRKRRRAWDASEGDDVCLDRLRSGQDYWRRSVRQSVSAPQVVTVVTDMSTRYDMAPDTILWRGCAALAMCYALEQAGYSCELLALEKTEDCYENGDNQQTGVWLKRAGDTLDIHGLVAAISGWCFRTLWFAAKAVPEGMRPDCGLGGPTAFAKEDLEWFCPGPWLTVAHVWSEHAAVECVRQQIARLETLSQEAA